MAAKCGILKMFLIHTHTNQKLLIQRWKNRYVCKCRILMILNKYLMCIMNIRQARMSSKFEVCWTNILACRR